MSPWQRVEFGMYHLSSYELRAIFGYDVYFVQFRSYARLSAHHFSCVTIETLRIIIERYGFRYNVALDALCLLSIFFAIEAQSVHFRSKLNDRSSNSIMIVPLFSSFIKPFY